MKKNYFSFLPLNVQQQKQNRILTERIRKHLQQTENTAISFSEFMQWALYDLEAGYYSSALPKFGSAGDFVTAPEISPLFAACLAQQCQEVLSFLGGGQILEIGAGTGRLACDLLSTLEKQGALPERYFILEISPDLTHRQQELINSRMPHLFSLIEWVSDWSAITIPIQGVVIANEVIDALPVQRFLWQKNTIKEMCVTWDDDLSQFAWKLTTPPCNALTNYLKRLKLDYFSQCEFYVSEVCWNLMDWINALNRVLQRGIVLMMDYGFVEREYYHFDRAQGTLVCHYQHQRHADPFVLVGLQDVTASVNFTYLAQCAVKAGLSIAGYTSQAAFLLNNGLLQQIEKCYNHSPLIDVNRQMHLLTSPNEMGEMVKVIAFARECEAKLQGFTAFDRRSSL